MLTKKVFLILSITVFIKLVKCFDSDSIDFQNREAKEALIAKYRDTMNKIIGQRNNLTEAAPDEQNNVPESQEPEFLYSRSPLHLIYLANMDHEIYKSLKKYSEVLKTRLELVNQYTKDFEETSLNPTVEAIIPNYHTDLFSEQEWNWAYKVSSHPITALQLLQRLSLKLPKIIRSVESECGDEADLVEDIDQAKDSLYWPTAQDVEDTENKILDLHQTYDFKLEKFINGENLGVSNAAIAPVRPLVKSELAHNLGLHAMRNEKYATALEWMSIALSKVAQEKNGSEATHPNFELIVIQNDYERLTNFHDNILKAKSVEIFGGENWGWENDLFTQEFKTLPSYKGTKVKDLYLKKEYGIFDIPTPLMENQLCSGVSWQDPTLESTLYCFYLTKNHSYLLLQPYKVEILNHLPQIVIIHDFFTQSTGLGLVEHSLNRVIDDPNQRDHLTPPPVPFNESEFPELKNLGHNFEILKSFHNQRNYFRTEEKFLTQFYSFGFNENVIDHFPSSLTEEPTEFPEEETFIIHLYLRDVDAGGYTIFPDLGISVKPTQGSALIFQTLKFQEFPNSPYLDLIWKNCPVISGLKWVGTKYYRQVGIGLKFDPLHDWIIQ